MKSKKKKEKLVITFDQKARREYLTGFQKRKKSRQNRAKIIKEEKEKLRKKEERKEKSKILKGKLDKYGLNSDDEEASVQEGKESSTLIDNHANHVVVIDMQPQFGPSLTAMAEEPELTSSYS